MTMIIDLATWLLEQIAWDARVAKMASGTPWETGVLGPRSVHVVMDGSRERRQLGYVATAENEWYAKQIALWDPARVLAECDAKRRIVELCTAEIQHRTDGAVMADSVLHLLAVAYADRPGYRDEWTVNR